MLLHSLVWLHLKQRLWLSSPKSRHKHNQVAATAYIETAKFPDYLQSQRHRLCLSTAKHLTLSITGKTFKQLLKNQRFMVLYSTIISFPDLGYFEKSRQNRLCSSHHKIKRYYSSSDRKDMTALRVTLSRTSKWYRLGGITHVLSVL